MKAKITLYIAGKITGAINPRGDFDAVEKLLRKAGYATVNPCAAFSAGQDWAWYMRQCLPMMMACDGVVTLPGWQSSKGAQLEVYLANELKIRVGSIVDWCGEEPKAEGSAA